MKLRCIGGALDGEFHEISDNYKYGDQVRLHLPLKFEISSFEEDLKAITEPKAITAAYYIIDKLIYHDNSRDKNPHIKMFLRHVEWSTWQCIAHQFDKTKSERDENILKAVKQFLIHGQSELSNLYRIAHTLLEE